MCNSRMCREVVVSSVLSQCVVASVMRAYCSWSAGRRVGWTTSEVVAEGGDGLMTGASWSERGRADEPSGRVRVFAHAALLLTIVPVAATSR